MVTQLGRRCPKLLKTVNGRPHATNRDHEPDDKEMMEAEANQAADVKREEYKERTEAEGNQSDVNTEEYKEMTEAEVNQSPRSSISDGNEMSPDAASLSKFAGYAADMSTSPLKGGSATMGFDSWETGSQRKPNRNPYRAGNNYALSKRKPTGGSDNIHGADHRQGNKRKRPPSKSTQGELKTLKAIPTLPETSAVSKPVTSFQTPPVFAFNDADYASTETSPASKDFQVPSSLGVASSSTPLSSPLLSPIEKDLPDIDFERPLEAQCPMCGSSVQQEHLDDFELQHPRMEFRSQQLFCRMHKKRESEDEWKGRRYPDIDWEELPCRLRKYRPVIDEILTTPVVSYFRSEMAKRLRRGKDRNLMMHVQHEGLQNCSVGYYGPRGMKVMTDFILAEFSDDIRSLAGSDKVIAARGATGYVQMVLAPELATRLVMDDMCQSHPNMKEKEAREILGSSSDLGYLLNGLEDSEQQAATSESLQIVVEDGLEDE